MKDAHAFGWLLENRLNLPSHKSNGVSFLTWEVTEETQESQRVVAEESTGVTDESIELLGAKGVLGTTLVTRVH